MFGHQLSFANKRQCRICTLPVELRNTMVVAGGSVEPAGAFAHGLLAGLSELYCSTAYAAGIGGVDSGKRKARGSKSRKHIAVDSADYFWNSKPCGCKRNPDRKPGTAIVDTSGIVDRCFLNSVRYDFSAARKGKRNQPNNGWWICDAGIAACGMRALAAGSEGNCIARF